MKSLEQAHTRERDERWKRSHQKQIANRVAMLTQGGKMSKAAAEAKASRMQDNVTNRARAQTEGRG